MSAVAAVHEDVHQGAGEKDEIRQRSQYVRPMLGDEKARRDDREDAEDPPTAAQQRLGRGCCWFRGMRMIEMFMACHGYSPWGS
jgi:hypothetical protein